MANNITLTGRLTADPELKTTASELSVCSFTLAVKRPHTKDTTDFLPCQAWRQSAEYLSRYGAKGNMVAATGSLTSRKWQDKDGNNRTSYEVICDSVELLTSNGSGEANNNTTYGTNKAQNNAGNATAYIEPQNLEELSEDDELPF